MTEAATNLLIQARDKISWPEAWTQGAFARRSEISVRVGDLSATCWCSLGACRSVGYNTELVIQAEGRLNAWTERNFGLSVEDYNDDPDRTKAEVLAMFDAAIEAGPLPHQRPIAS